MQILRKHNFTTFLTTKKLCFLSIISDVPRGTYNKKYTVNFRTMEIEDIKGWWEISPEENLQDGCYEQ